MLSAQAQKLSVEKIEPLGPERDSLTYLYEFGNGCYVVSDSNALKLLSRYSPASAYFDQNDETNPRSMAYYEAEEEWGIACINALPEDILQKIIQHAEEYAKDWPMLCFCIAPIEFDKDGKIINLQLWIVGKLYESMTRDQIERLYWGIQKSIVPLVNYFDFSSGNAAAATGIDIMQLAVDGKISLPKETNNNKHGK